MWGVVSELGHVAALSRFLRCWEKTRGPSVRSSETQALDCTSSPPKMTRVLFMSLVSFLIAINQASLINRCDLARVLRKEDLDGFEGYSLNDCECCFSHPPHFSSSPVHAIGGGHLSVIRLSKPSSKGSPPQEALPNIPYSFHNY